MDQSNYNKVCVVQDWLLGLISLTFFERILCTKVRSKPNFKQRKDVHTKNVSVKHWWNWHLGLISLTFLRQKVSRTRWEVFLANGKKILQKVHQFKLKIRSLIVGEIDQQFFLCAGNFSSGKKSLVKSTPEVLQIIYCFCVKYVWCEC